MAQEATEIPVPPLGLTSSPVGAHCQALQRIGALPFWWYLGTSRLLGNFSVPFEARGGTWWYQVKPGLCWPVEFFRPIPPGAACPALHRRLLGYQHVVPDESQANSHLVINTIRDLAAYTPQAINAKRRNAIRKGLRSCHIERLTELHGPTVDECRAAWNALTERTGWKSVSEKADFDRSWAQLLEVPGATILVGRAAETGEVAGFLITKIIGDTAYVDTIASRSDMLKYNVNDALMFAFLMNARQLAGVRMAHYAIRSYVATLEKFKTGLGFEPIAFPALTRLQPAVRLALRLLKPAAYRRMLGEFDEPPVETTSPATAEES